MDCLKQRNMPGLISFKKEFYEILFFRDEVEK